MAVLVGADSIVEVKYFCFFAGQIAINGIHYVGDPSSAGTMTLDKAAEEISDAAQDLYAALLTSEALFIGVKVTLKQTTPAPTPGIFQTEVTGLAGEEPLPTQVASVLTLKTDLAGVRNRGRIYVPFPDEADNDTDHTPTLSYLDRLDALADVVAAPLPIADGLSLLTLNPIMFHPIPGINVPITDHRANNRWGSQRRRGSYGAPNLPIVS